MPVTQHDRLDAVLSRLERTERSLYECKQILQHIKELGGFIQTSDREGLWPGQLDYQVVDKPSYRRQEETRATNEEVGICYT